MAPTTNADTVYQFFTAMSARHNLAGTVLVLDNHRAHMTGKVLELFQELQFQLLFLPPASSILNPIETLWAHVKRQWRRSLLSADPKQLSEAWMSAELKTILLGFTELDLERLSRAHFTDIEAVLDEAVSGLEQLRQEELCHGISRLQLHSDGSRSSQAAGS